MIQVKSMMLIASLILLLSGAAESWNNVTNQNYMVCKPISELVAPNPTSNSSEHVFRGEVGKSGPRGERGPRGFPGNSPFPADFNISRFAEMETRLGQLEATNEVLEAKSDSLEGTVQQQGRKIRQLELETVPQLEEENEAQTTKIRQLERTVERLQGAATECQFDYKVTATAQSWEESRTLCQAMGGDLAVHGMKNYARRREIQTQLKLRNLDGNLHHIWIGMSDLATEGVWRWLDGSRVGHTSARWFPREPNGGARENCGDIYPDGRLNDCACSRTWRWRAICEIKYPRGCTP